MFWYDDRYWKPFDARSEGAPIFRQKKKFGFFVQWSFERGSSVFSNLSYLRESYRFYKLKLQKAMILSDFIFENYPLWKSQLDEKNKLFFADFRGTAHLPTGRHFLNSLYTIPMTVWPYLTIWANFSTKCERVSFLPFIEKNWTFFQKSKIDYMA